MALAVYILSMLTSAGCSALLLRGFRRSNQKLLLWSGICFAGLSVSNLLVFVDLVLLPDVDLYLARLVSAAVSMLVLVYALIWESR